MPNRLAESTSPYLRQHADNPVDWWEWGEEPFAEARRRDVPVLLSVGYAACHWCHVMAHESFEDDAAAEIMNRDFVNVKVDREERPDVDAVYMEAVQALTGRGGWPMTVWLTPERRPFFAGTYFPREDRHGIASFTRVLESVTRAWRNDRRSIIDQAGKLTEAISREIPPGELPTEEVLRSAFDQVIGAADPINGGFGTAPKFPQPPVLEFLLRVADRPWAAGAKPVLRQTLIRMARGGIYDHVIGGFARYSVDESWLVPHFEKMLYDNAQLARVYLRAGQVLDEPSLWTITDEVIEYMNNHLRHPDGGYYSAQDADSEGEEGKFAVFDHGEFVEVTGEDAEVATRVFGVTERGNFEGKNILHRAASHAEVAESLGMSGEAVDAAVDRALGALEKARSHRVPPLLDDKVVASWNGLAIRALAEAGAVLGEDQHVESARSCARFVLDQLVDDQGRLQRSWSQGRAGTPAFLEDYGAMATGLLALYQVTGEFEWYRSAKRLISDAIELFTDESGGAMFSTGRDAEELITRKKDQMDNPLPSGNSLMSEALMMLSAYEGDADLAAAAEAIMAAGGVLVDRYPSAVGHLLAVVASRLEGMREVAIVGPDAHRLADAVWEGFHPDVALAVSVTDAAPIPLLEGRWSEDSTLAYVCRDFVCDRPVATATELASALRG
ncbi:MAG: thioredoxin domain-containing protein [Acidimicrobiia bacterium]|nr:thioredoxin domain-containing protein [Acidimicrobiia bacterium]